VGTREVLAAVLDALPSDQRDRISVKVPTPVPPALADAALLDRVLANLIDNALRHTPPASPVTVHVSSEAEQVRVRVVDRGQGVPAHDLERLFTPFQRLDDRTEGGILV
jgi:two-component system sensor histidine kinase KdpD